MRLYVDRISIEQNEDFITIPLSYFSWRYCKFNIFFVFFNFYFLNKDFLFTIKNSYTKFFQGLKIFSSREVCLRILIETFVIFLSCER